ncbi:hypothetical protein LTR15_010021 [Elasticomyces elasticus]|nr:hypothetical protein LTR15_010021 [Elasticomyces elasticus]
MAQQVEYVYSPLNVEQMQIRMIELQAGHYEDPLRASVQIISLVEGAEYETISYVWGDPLKSSDLQISGVRLVVPINTDLALRRVRHQDTVRRLWIDSICINQKDIHERGQQVSLMGSVYGHSMGNLIHLTDDDDMGERILQMAHQVEQEARAETNDFEDWGSMLWNEAGGARYDVQEEREDLDTEAMWFLMRLPWFRRLWILQEAAVSPSNICYLGRISCPLQLLLRAIRWLDYTSQTSYPQSPADLAGRDCITSLFDLTDHDLGLFALMGEEGPEFSNLLGTATQLERSEPIDGVFAVLGMLSTPPEDIVPDYTTPVQVILRKATRHILRQRNDLQALSLVSHGAVTIEGCSWACPFDQVFNNNKDPEVLDLRFAASTGLGNPTKLAGDPLAPETVVLEGLIVEEVRATSTVCSSSILSDLSAFHSWVFDAVGVLRRPMRMFGGTRQGANLGALTDIALALTVDRNRAADIAQADDIAAVTAYLYTLVESPTEDLREANGVYDVFEEAETHFHPSIALNRRLFHTASGRHGLGPQAMRLGDIVAVLRGGRTLFVLRPLGEEFQLVGEAYVNGMMDGEAVYEAHARGIAEGIFIVR